MATSRQQCCLLVVAIVVAHLSIVTSLPWKSPPQWKLPPLPDKRGEGGEQGEQPDLLSRVRHLEQVVERRLADIEKLKKVRALEQVVRKELAAVEGEEVEGRAEREQGTAGGRTQGEARQGRTEGGEEREGGEGREGGVLERELLQREDPGRGSQGSEGHQRFDPMPKLKQISRDLQDLIEEIDRHT